MARQRKQRKLLTLSTKGKKPNVPTITEGTQSVVIETGFKNNKLSIIFHQTGVKYIKTMQFLMLIESPNYYKSVQPI